MSDAEHKLDVLADVAKRLNQARVTWAVGASLLLYLKGKLEEFHDIDILVVEEDIEKVQSILSELGSLQSSGPNVQYKTRHFLECVIDGVDLDVMAGFIIVHDGVQHDCSLKKEEIVDSVLVKGQTIPLQSLALWKRYYELMGRTERAQLL